MDNMEIEIGPIDTIIFFGGGLFLLKCVFESNKKGFNTCVFAARRHLHEIIDYQNNESMENILMKEGIPYFQVSDINKSKEIKKVITENTLGIGVGEVYIFKKEIIQLFNNKIFDFMTIKLPQYRGGAHFTWQILRNDKIGGWYVQVINEEMIPGRFDSGEILLKMEYSLPEDSKIPKDYFNAAEENGLIIFKKFIEQIYNNEKFILSKLNEKKNIYFPRLNTLNHGFIDWSWNSSEIKRFICAFDDPYPGSLTFLDSKRVFLKKCSIYTKDGDFHPFMAGLIYRIHNKEIYIATRDKSIIIQSCMDKDGNDIINLVQPGQRFITPRKYLEGAMGYNAEYNSEGLIINGEKKNGNV